MTGRAIARLATIVLLATRDGAAAAQPEATAPAPVDPAASTSGGSQSDAAPADPPASTEWHKEPVLEKAVGRNVVLYNHADPTLECATIVALLQQQYDFLKEYVGLAPRWVLVHVGSRYPCGFSIHAGRDPEMFLQSASIFDTSANFAHEMMHCFMFAFGELPHWFNESMSDVAYVDSEIELWKRRREKEFLATFDRVDHRSYELLQLRARFGRACFRRLCAAMVKRRDECRRTFVPSEKLETKNVLLLALLSEAAGEDVAPLFKEWGFNPRTRERQRGY